MQVNYLCLNMLANRKIVQERQRNLSAGLRQQVKNTHAMGALGPIIYRKTKNRYDLLKHVKSYM